MSLSFTKLTADDYASFRSLFEYSIRNLFPGEYSDNSVNFILNKDYGSEWMQSAVEKGDRIAYIAKDKKNVIGFVFVSKTYGGVSTASWVAVKPSHQNQGIATRLIQLWEADAVDSGAHSLFLWTGTEKRVKFYEKRGFREGGLFPKSWFGNDLYMMYKNIREPHEENYLKVFLLENNR